MDRVGVAILGLGTIGQGVSCLLHEAGDRIERRTGRRVEVRWALVRNLSRPRNSPLASTSLLTDPSRIWSDAATSIVVEALGGLEPARSHVLRALECGKDVVTANKALLASHGPEIFEAARRAGRVVAFEASVGGGIPIIQALQVGLAANQIQAISAILNGTCNYILTAMTREGLSYGEALEQAKALGFAEPDPTLDVDGTDTAHKLIILAQLAFGATVVLDQVPRQGIDRLSLADLRYAAELGYALKLLALARLVDSELILRVAPRLVRKGTPLAEVPGPYNAIRVHGDAVGNTLFMGRGAGALPTASAVVADIMELVIGRGSILARASTLWDHKGSRIRLAGSGKVKSRYYLRFQIADRPGVLATIARILGGHNVSIASVIQHDPGDDTQGSFVPLVIMTHMAVESSIRAALSEIDQLDIVAPPSVCLGVEEAIDS